MDSELRDQTWVEGQLRPGGPRVVSAPFPRGCPQVHPWVPSVRRLSSRLSERPSVTSRRDRQGAAAARVASAPSPPHRRFKMDFPSLTPPRCEDQKPSLL